MSVTAESQLAEAQALIHYLQSSGEISRAAVARRLHDDIAELMVAALMDLSAVAPSLPHLELRAHEQLARAKTALGTAIDYSRKLVEELRPTLLDHVGLFTGTQMASPASGQRNELDLYRVVPCR